MMNDTQLALDALLTRYLNLFSDNQPSLPYVEFQSSWPSECIVECGKSDGEYYWKHKTRESKFSFADLEKALEIKFHPDICSYYGTFWANGFCAERDDINLSLIQIWNAEDEAQLKQNMLGHVFAKIKSKLPVTFFIGCTFGDDIICLDQDTGQIVLEKPGYSSKKTLSDNLSEFLISLSPTTDKYSN